MLSASALPSWDVLPRPGGPSSPLALTRTRKKATEGPWSSNNRDRASTFTFKTISLSNGQECDFQTYETPVDQGGGREDDDLPAKGGTTDDGIKFTIVFKGNEAMVDVESRGGECGMSGNFGGKYQKISKQ